MRIQIRFFGPLDPDALKKMRIHDPDPHCILSELTSVDPDPLFLPCGSGSAQKKIADPWIRIRLKTKRILITVKTFTGERGDQKPVSGRREAEETDSTTKRQKIYIRLGEHRRHVRHVESTLEHFEKIFVHFCKDKTRLN